MIMKVKDYMIIKADTNPIYEGTTVSLKEVKEHTNNKGDFIVKSGIR
jgi:hypothetical protein